VIMASPFISIDRNCPIELPASLEGWLREDHLARFIVDVVEQLDLSAIEQAYGGRGSPAYPPKLMVALLFYGYATGVFSSRKLERATYESVPFIYIAGGLHPDHDSINSFRKRFLTQLEELFVQILLIAHRLGVLKLGDIFVDGSKVKANASKHKAMSWEYAHKLEAQLKAEVEKLLEMAETPPDQGNRGLNIPAEIARREERLTKIAEAKAEIERRAQERHAREKADYDEKMARRAAQEKQTGKKPGGRAPKAPTPGPQDKDQVNFTDEESRIMPVSGGGFEQAYNGQIGVEGDSRLIVCQHISQQPNDKQELAPALDQLAQLPEELGQVKTASADTGYYSEDNVSACAKAGVVPYSACGREPHYPPLEERLAGAPQAPENPDPVSALRHRLKTAQGKAHYARRNSTVEPVFGIIKHVIGFRHFMLRGLKAVQGEWTLVCIAFNLKRLHTLKGVKKAAEVAASMFLSVLRLAMRSYTPLHDPLGLGGKHVPCESPTDS
jgi:transposase